MNGYLSLTADIETRDIYDSAVITRIAITPFRFDEDKDVTFQELVDRTLYISLDQEEQIARGRTCNPSTEAWWASQPEDLRIESYYPTDKDLPVVEAFAEIKRFLSRWHYDHYESIIWARNNGFENFKIQSLNEQFLPGTKHVLNHWNWHELKTANLILTGGETSKYNPSDFKELNFDAHNAIHDAAMDTYRLLHLWHQDF